LANLAIAGELPEDSANSQVVEPLGGSFLSIEEAAGSWQQTAQEQRDSGQPLVPPAASAGQAPT
jgi:hypothetical protein